jgi:hypothetical protein
MSQWPIGWSLEQATKVAKSTSTVRVIKAPKDVMTPDPQFKKSKD